MFAVVVILLIVLGPILIPLAVSAGHAVTSWKNPASDSAS